LKELYEIKFFPHETVDIKDKDKTNEKIVREVINEFGDESKVLKKQKLLVYFGMFPSGEDFPLKVLGTVKAKGTTEYDEFIKEVINKESEKIDNLETFKYLIYLSKNIRTCDNKKYKIFTIAHELQHVLQYLGYSCLHEKHSVLFRYFILTKSNIFELPKEQDAIRKAKIINYRIFGKRDVDNFIDEKIQKSREDIEKLYWENVKSIDLNIEYDLESRVKEFWRNYEGGIKESAKRLRGKIEPELNERAFLDAYEAFLIDCKKLRRVEPGDPGSLR